MNKFFITTVLLCFVFHTNISSAGKLDDFEEEATSESTSTSERRVKRRNEEDNTAGEELANSIVTSLLGGLLEAAAVGLRTTGGDSLYKAKSSFDDSEHPTLKPRRHGQRLVPFARFDTLFGEFESDLELQDYLVEAGYGAFSATYRYSRFQEKSPSDLLILDQTFINYRMTLGDRTQLDLGLGNYGLKGNQDLSDRAFRFGFSWIGDSRFGVEYNYVFTAGDQVKINDKELALLYSYDYISLKAAYRIINGRSADLRGPSLGLSFHF